MMRTAPLAAALLLCVTAHPAVAVGGAPKSSTPAPPSPREQAVEHYNKGLEHRDKAWKHEKKAAAAGKEKDRAKSLNKARKEFGKAVKQQLSATAKDSSFHEAFSSLGYAHRKVGEYAEALAAYDRCLELAPDYAEAIEYRGEAYLGLNRIDDAQRSYFRLVARDGDRAAELLAAMDSWVEEREAAPVEGIDSELLAAVRRWVADKKVADPAASAGAKKW